MRIDVHHYLHCDEQGPIVALLSQLVKKVNTMSQVLDNLVAKVEALETVEASAVKLLGDLKAALDAAVAAGDLSAVQAIADRIGTDTDALAAAVTANTPAAPAAGGDVGAIPSA